MKVVMITAPYTSAPPSLREDITRVVEATALALWENGVATITPHLNSGHFGDHREGTEGPNYKRGYKEIAGRCDALLSLFPSKKAPGQADEHYVAKAHNLPIFKDIKALLKWAKGGQ